MNEEFFEAVRTGKLEKVQQMLDQEPELAAARNEAAISAVTLAMYNGQSQAVTVLVRRGAPLDVFEASMTGAVDRLQAYLDKQPELANAFAVDGFQPLGLAAFFGQTAAVELLLGRGASVNSASHNEQSVMPLHSAAAGQHLQIAGMLLAHGADPNATQAWGFTPLHSAAQNGQIAMIRLLLDHGADLQARSQDRRSPLDLALAEGHVQAAQLLE